MPAFRPKGAWKWDTILWDADRQVAGIGREFIRLGDASLALRVHWNDEQGYTNDVYSAHAGQFVIRSVDSGFTWQRYDDPVLDENQTRLRNGELVKVYSGGQAIEEKRELLHQVGANPDTASIEGNDLWPESMRAELEGKGYVVEKSFPGIIGTLTSLSCSISVDGGKTYIRRKIDLPPLARTYGSFRRCIELRDGTILAACCGRRKANSPEFNFVLRSVDQGRTWSFHVIADDGAARLQFNETEIHELPDRRILAMFRCHHMGESVGNYLYQSTSEDGGKSWTAFRRTPIWGYPPQLITLSSGAVLVTYAHRRHPFGVRACLSRNGGETWDYENEKIICDDSLPGLVQYPTSSQLDDGTILTAYAISKIPRIPYRPDDQVGPDTDLLIHRRQRIGKDQHWVGGYHGFAGLSRYTEDYIRAPGQTTSKTMYHGKGGNDEE
ncbi:MAG TPA: sialidase family protein [Terriglobales bacterium]|nr:sialidase family protein [Terriglobales bacterium]